MMLVCLRVIRGNRYQRSASVLAHDGELVTLEDLLDGYHLSLADASQQKVPQPPVGQEELADDFVGARKIEAANAREVDDGYFAIAVGRQMLFDPEADRLSGSPRDQVPVSSRDGALEHDLEIDRRHASHLDCLAGMIMSN